MGNAICQDPYNDGAYLDEQKARLRRSRWLPARVGNTIISMMYK